jgi:integrase
MITIMDLLIFLSQYSSKSTRDNYGRALETYFRLHYPNTQLTPQELSIQYLRDKRDYKPDLIRYRDSLLPLAPKTRLSYLAAIIRFLEDNDMTLNPSFKRNIYGKETDAITEEYVPTNADLARLVEFMPIHARALTLVLSSSGMRIGEALSLWITDIDFEKNPTRITICGKNTKTKKKRITFISTEAKNVLQEWLTYRNRNFKDDNRIFPFSLTNYNQIWTLACRKVGLDKRDVNTRRLALHPHSLRKFFRTYGRWSNPDCAKALLDHTSGLTAIYSRLDQAESILEQEYLRCEPNLSIYENSRNVTELKQKVEQQSSDLTQLVTTITLRRARTWTSWMAGRITNESALTRNEL